MTSTMLDQGPLKRRTRRATPECEIGTCKACGKVDELSRGVCETGCEEPLTYEERLLRAIFGTSDVPSGAESDGVVFTFGG